MQKFYLYILHSDKDGKFYIGSTSNLDERLKRHSAGYVNSTKARRPLKLVHSEEFENRADAVKRERYLKSLKNTTHLRKHLGLQD